ncbi:tRNA (adenosine(37)-N6)-threonylcarbamoyltransferase complex ATPase subunit type 1 TsaE [Candidatus Saccharibacteria bacterium]|nr:tRNA (adenosine(37)-N6)-threonylcarbamoyltransferase complex ATPase subunit type 1 TsaE [Candidatus Saccharibacteria bacterium]
MIISSEAEMLQFGADFAKKLTLPAVIELIGDVGAGKTTFTRGLAKGLGIVEPVTSPSFTISKSYAGSGKNLIHYDFYRLDDPGLMADDLAEALSAENTVVVVEWGDDIENILPKDCIKITIKINSDGTRELEL